MAHEIEDNAMAYKGETPWHGLGENLPEKQSIEKWTKAAKLNWELQKLPLQYTHDGKLMTYDNRVVLARSDTGKALGVASDSHFKIVQPREVLEFYRDLIKDHGYSLETAGCLKGGARVWALANIGKTFRAGKKDLLKAYLLFATGMDGKFSTVCKLTGVRVVCNNTLTMALNGIEGESSDGTVKLRHSSEFDATKVKLELGLLPQQIKLFERQTEILTDAHITDDEAKAFFSSVTKSEVESKKVASLMLAYKQGPGADLATADGTLWGAVNAVSYTTDHLSGRSADTRLNRAWFGSNERLKNRALRSALELAVAA